MVAWSRAVRKAPAEQILAAARAYAMSPHRPDKQFVPYGASWLNAERWNDPLPEPPAALRGRLSPDDRLRDGLERGERLAALVGREALG